MQVYFLQKELETGSVSKITERYMNMDDCEAPSSSSSFLDEIPLGARKLASLFAWLAFGCLGAVALFCVEVIIIGDKRQSRSEVAETSKPPPFPLLLGGGGGGGGGDSRSERLELLLLRWPEEERRALAEKVEQYCIRRWLDDKVTTAGGSSAF